MDKKQAAEFLGISERTLNRYVEKGAIGVQYAKGKGDVTVAEFNREELERFKEQQAQGEFKPAVQTNHSQALTTRVDNTLMETGSLLRDTGATLRLIAEKMSAGPVQRVAVESKLLLDIKECSQLTGLSKDYLKAAIKDKKLKGRIIGRGWKVKRSDLDAYIAKL